jgi:hypothetical protein
MVCTCLLTGSTTTGWWLGFVVKLNLPYTVYVKLNMCNKLLLNCMC